MSIFRYVFVNYEPLISAAHFFSLAVKGHICVNCGHHKDVHTGTHKLNEEGKPTWRGTHCCTELIQVGGFRTAPKECPCEGFETIPISRRELFKQLVDRDE